MKKKKEELKETITILKVILEDDDFVEDYPKLAKIIFDVTTEFETDLKELEHEKNY